MGRREDEMARGAAIVARLEEEQRLIRERDERIELLSRWSQAGKVKISITGRPATRRAFVNGEAVAVETSDEYPSELFVAKIALAIGALSSFDGIPEHSSERARELQERQRKDENRHRQGQWKTIYERR